MTLCFDLAVVDQGSGQRLGECEQRIDPRPKCPQRQPGRSLAPQPRDYAGLEQRGLACARSAENDERAQVALGSHFSQLFESLGEFTAAAIEQGGVGIIVAKRSKTGERDRTKLGVNGIGLRVEADFRSARRRRASHPSTESRAQCPQRG